MTDEEEEAYCEELANEMERMNKEALREQAKLYAPTEQPKEEFPFLTWIQLVVFLVVVGAILLAFAHWVLAWDSY